MSPARTTASTAVVVYRGRWRRVTSMKLQKSGIQEFEGVPKSSPVPIPKFRVSNSKILKFLNSWILKLSLSDTNRSIRVNGGLPALHHSHFHATLRGSLQVDFVHEVANEK